MLQQHGAGLAGHLGGEAGDAPARQPCPFAVGAGQADQRRRLPQRRQQADELGLLPAHHVRHATGVARGQARHQAAGGALERQRHHRGGDLRRAGGAGQVGRLDPALPAADHAAEQDAALAGGQPGADGVTQRVREAARRDAQDAGRAVQALPHAALVVDPVGAEGGGAPVDADHGGRLAGAGQACTYRATCRRSGSSRQPRPPASTESAMLKGEGGGAPASQARAPCHSMLARPARGGSKPSRLSRT